MAQGKQTERAAPTLGAMRAAEKIFNEKLFFRMGMEEIATIIDSESGLRELLEAAKAIADLANGQGQANLMMVAGQARAAIARSEWWGICKAHERR